MTMQGKEPWMACLNCLKGSIVKNDAEFIYGACVHCGNVMDCIRGESVELFIPYIPLLEPRSCHKDDHR